MYTLLENNEKEALIEGQSEPEVFHTVSVHEARSQTSSGGASSGVATGGMGGPDPPTSIQTPLGISANPLKFFLHIGGTPCMYIVTFTAHQQRNMVRTPHFFGAGDATGCQSAAGRHCLLGIPDRRKRSLVCLATDAAPIGIERRMSCAAYPAGTWRSGNGSISSTYSRRASTWTGATSWRCSSPLLSSAGSSSRWSGGCSLFKYRVCSISDSPQPTARSPLHSCRVFQA